jgi:site-specific recombinase XerD
MRTTLDIDNDLLEAAKELARKQNISAGQVVSQLLRRALTGQPENLSTSQAVKPKIPSVAGFHPFPAGKAVVSNDTVNRLREDEGV